MSLGLLATLSLTASAHVPDWAKPLEINPALGVPGFPDCERDAALAAAGAEPEMALKCAQKEAKDDGVISIGCVGDSITAGVCSTGGKCVPPPLSASNNLFHGRHWLKLQLAGGLAVA